MVDIHSEGKGASRILSNFHAHTFTIDGIECKSMEGFLQSLKFSGPEMQVTICQLVGMAAKNRGRRKNWRRSQTLWWQGVPIHRSSPEYQALIDRAYEAIASQSPKFGQALLSTGDAPITHSIGWHKPNETILTEQEFCSRLLKIRERLKLEQKAQEAARPKLQSIHPLRVARRKR